MRRVGAVAAAVLVASLAVGVVDPQVAAGVIACTKTWAVPGSSGLWNDPLVADHLEAQWSPAGVPGPADTPCLPAGDYTVTLLHGTDLADLRVGETGGGAQPTLVISGENAFDSTTVRVWGPTGGENHGTIRLGHDSLVTTDTFQVTPGTFTNEGTIQLVAGGGGGRYLDGNPSGTFVNHGTLHSSTPQGYLGCTTLVSDGTITIDSGATLDWGNCGQVHVDLTGGTVTNDGLFVAPSSLDVSGTTTLTGNPVRVASGPVSFDGTPTGTIQVWSSTITGTIPTGIHLLVDHPSDGASATLSTTGPVTNHGTITLTSNGNAGHANLQSPSSTVTNEGTIELVSGGGGNRLLDGNPSGTFVNHGTLHSSTPQGYLGCTTLVSDGTITIDSGATLDWGNCGQVHVDLTGGTVTNDGLFVAPSSLDVSGTTTLTGNPARVASGPVSFDGAPTGTIQVWSSTITGTIPTGIHVVIDNPADDASATLSATGPVTNHGTITLTSDGNAGHANLGLSGQTLTNEGTIELQDGAGGSGERRLQGGALTNHGTVEVTSSAGRNGCNATTSDGTIEIATGASILTSCGGQTYDITGGTLVADGEIEGTFSVAGGTVQGTGTLRGGVTNSGGVVAPGASAGTLSVVGTFTQSAAGTLAVEIEGTAPGSFDRLHATGAVTLGGTLAVDARAVPKPAVAVVASDASVTGSFAEVTGIPDGWVTVGGTAVSVLAAATFDDVPLTHPFFLDIEWAAAEGLVKGFAGGDFKPGRDATRQAVVAILHRLAGNTGGVAPCTSAPFTDVPTSHPFCGEIAWAAAEGLVGGFADGSFKPTRPITRQALMAILYRMAGNPDGTEPACTAAPFTDVPTSHPFCGEIAWAAAEGLANGFADGGFRPAERLTRQAITAFMHRFALGDHLP